MKDRIRLIMEYEHLTPSLFADKLKLGRAVMSHILNGRNNPSLEVATRILTQMDYIDPEWLLTGKGSMLKNKIQTNTSSVAEPKDNMRYGDKIPNQIPEDIFSSTIAPDLFSQNLIEKPTARPDSEYRKEIVVPEVRNETEKIINKEIEQPVLKVRKVVKIIIYYNDNTFETFNADNKPF